MEKMKQLQALATADPRYQRLLREAETLDASFLALRMSLPPDQLATLDRYLTLCEEMDHLLILTALDL